MLPDVSKNDFKKVRTCPTVGTYLYKQPNFTLVFCDFNVKITDVQEKLHFGKKPSTFLSLIDKMRPLA